MSFTRLRSGDQVCVSIFSWTAVPGVFGSSGLRGSLLTSVVSH
jgi:hypothetical protein